MVVNETRTTPSFSSPVALADVRALELANTPVEAVDGPPLDGHEEVAKTNLKTLWGREKENNKELRSRTSDRTLDTARHGAVTLGKSRWGLDAPSPLTLLSTALEPDAKHTYGVNPITATWYRLPGEENTNTSITIWRRVLRARRNTFVNLKCPDHAQMLPRPVFRL